MAKKRNHKNLANNCLVCGYEFKEYKEKNIHRINPEKRNSLHNSLVICDKCNKMLQKENKNILDIKLDCYIINLYYKSFDIDMMKKFLRKYNWRKKWLKLKEILN